MTGLSLLNDLHVGKTGLQKSLGTAIIVLTIRETQQMGGMRWFLLGYPNQEVRQSLTDYILSFLTNSTVAQENNKFNLYEALIANNFDAIKQILQAFFSSIPHDWYRRNQLANYEGYYASIVYCYFILA